MKTRDDRQGHRRGSRFDDLFAYDTVKLVQVLDRRLGIVYYIVLLAVVAYFCFVFLRGEAQLVHEKAPGWVICTGTRYQLSDLGVKWDIYDRITNPGEMNACFIPTRVLITRGQIQDGRFCESPKHNCTRDLDCDAGDPSVQTRCSNGRCMRRQWCPAEEPGSAATETHYLDFEKVQLKFQSFVYFLRMRLDVSTVDEDDRVMYPVAGANTYPLHDMLRMANLRYDSLVENGAIIAVNSVFKCNMDSERCDTKIESVNVDTVTGFNHQVVYTYRQGNATKRDLYRMYGIRLVASAMGFGDKTSFVQLVLQLSSAISLAKFATTAADFVMTNLVPERTHYSKLQIIETEDFGDVTA